MLKLDELPSNQAVYICSHVFENIRSMDYVSYQDDGDLIILCKEHDHDFSNPLEVRVVGFGHLIARDTSLGSVPPLELGMCAERLSPDDEWRTYQSSK